MSEGEAYAFYKSGAWKRVRALAMRRPVTLPDGRICPPLMCERCFAAGRLAPAEIVHHVRHITPANIHDPEVTLSPSNLMRVCRDCHAAIHAGDGYTPRVAFDENGRVTRI